MDVWSLTGNPNAKMQLHKTKPIWHIVDPNILFKPLVIYQQCDIGTTVGKVVRDHS